MNKISDLPYPFKARSNQFAVRQRMTRKLRVRAVYASFKQAKTASTFRLLMSVVAAVTFAVLLTLSLAAGALYLVE